MSTDQLFQQANAAYRAGDFADAALRYQALTKLKPNWAFNNLGAAYVAMGRFEEAEAAFRSALAVEPESSAARAGLGRILMAAGRYLEGWPLMEARRDRSDAPKPVVGCPEWQGENLRGKRLLVYPEQGFGDQIMFFRLLLRLAAEGAQVTVIAPSPLVRLFEGRGVAVVEALPGCRIPDGDYWTLICSVPFRIGVTLETIPSAPYLTLPQKSGGGVGVVATGNPTHLNDRNRSLPPNAAAQLAAMGQSLAPQDTGARDFYDTAEIITGLDLVISVDTSVVHLAAAMGKPVWVLLPVVETDWRWLRDRADSPWYPSARLYRQSAPGDWATVLRKVSADLTALSAA